MFAAPQRRAATNYSLVNRRMPRKEIESKPDCSVLITTQSGTKVIGIENCEFNDNLLKSAVLTTRRDEEESGLRPPTVCRVRNATYVAHYWRHCHLPSLVRKTFPLGGGGGRGQR